MEDQIVITNEKELHSYLEGLGIFGYYQIKLSMSLRTIAEGIEEPELKQKAIWENNAFNFELSEGKAMPIMQNTKEDGTSIWSYPSFDEFNTEGIEYLKQRAAKAKSDILIAWYNQVMWNSPAPHKHEQYARRAVDAYLRILTNPQNIVESKKDGNNLLRIFKNGFTLALMIKYKIPVYKQILHSYLFERGKFSQDLKIPLLKFMLEYPQLKKNDFEGTLALVAKLGRQKAAKPSYYDPKWAFETGLKIAQRCGTDTKIWYKRLGDAAVRAAENRMDDKTNMVPLSFYSEAIDHYRKAGAEKKAELIEQKYFELKGKLKLEKFDASLSEKNAKLLEKYTSGFVNKVLKREPVEIIEIIMSGKYIFPEKASLVAMSRNKQSAFMDFTTKLSFDRNNNLTKKTGKTSEKEKLYENYHFHVQFNTIPLLHKLFMEGIKKQKITFNSLAIFIQQRTWLGQPLQGYGLAGDITTYNWISLIAPSLLDYFFQVESALKSNQPFTNFIMPIDSLTLKFEGVIRDFARLVNVSTSTNKRGVMREKYIEELLADRKIQSYFDEADLMLFNYLFASKEGLNIRNNVAHSFYKYEDYSFHLIHLLICAFLRIGKYKVRAVKRA